MKNCDDLERQKKKNKNRPKLYNKRLFISRYKFINFLLIICNFVMKEIKEIILFKKILLIN